MKRDDTVYLQHIVDAINKINQYLTGIEEEEFYEESLYPLQNGVLNIVRESGVPFFLTGGIAKWIKKI